MAQTTVKDLLSAGVHFGHLTRKWNPNMAPYIYMERNGIHIISLYKTVAKIEEASEALAKIASSGRKILFVATKKQAKDIVSECAKKVNMPYITERWPGGMLTNFITIRKAVKKRLMLLFYRILINLVLVLSPIIILFRLIKKKEHPNRFLEKLGFPSSLKEKKVIDLLN